MTAQALKNSILQLAMQGKLVPQDPNDEPASVLEKTIQKERNKLRRNSRCIPVPLKIEDFPFDIPESWIFIRFADLVRFSSGKTPGRNELKYWDSHEIPWVAISDMVHGKIISDTKEKISQKAMLDCFPNGICPKGTLIMSFKLTIGKISFLGMNAVHNEAIISIFPFVNKDNLNTLKQYLFHILPMICNSGDSKNAIMGRTLNSTSLSNLIIPLPPIAEQSRIVKKIEELLPLIERYDESEKRLLELNKKFPDELRKAILQQAVQGKLTEQDPHDEPANELIKRIKAEKARLIKEGTIKKQKSPTPIREEEKPFEIPDNWIWCRVSDIVLQNLGGGTPAKNVPGYWGGDIPWASVKDLPMDDIWLNTTQDAITRSGLNNSSSNLIPRDNIIICTRMGLGKVVVNTIDVAINQDLRALLVSQYIHKMYLIHFFKSARLVGKGQTVKGITIDVLENMLLPLPPLEEQRRIVAKIDEVLPLCDRLK